MLLDDLVDADGDAQQFCTGSQPGIHLMQLDSAAVDPQCQVPQGGGSLHRSMLLDADVNARSFPLMEFDTLPGDSRATSAGQAASARVSQMAKPAMAARQAASARVSQVAKPAMVARRAASAAAQAKAARWAARSRKGNRGRFQNGTGAEYAKHLAFRRDWTLVLPGGKWAQHGGLRDVPLAGLTAREVDVLHILWLVLEKKGYDPKAIDQAWLLCQSIHREGGPYPKHYFRGRLPGTPGFHIEISGAGPAFAPCVLPRGKLWLNPLRRLASAAELLQLQGVNVPSSIPWWRQADVAMVKRYLEELYDGTEDLNLEGVVENS